MPPKKINNNKIKIVATNNEDTLEDELKFDKEVLWCITQFEKLIETSSNDSKSRFLF